MKPTSIISIYVFLISLFFLLDFQYGVAQNYSFKHYDLQDGICHPFTYTINQDENGYLWIATGEGLCKFNGLSFQKVNTDSISTALVNVIFKDSENRLWFGFNDGKVAYYNGRELVELRHELEISSAIKGIHEMDGHIIIGTLINGILMVDENMNVSLNETIATDKTISSIHRFKNKLLVGTQEGLFVYTGNPTDHSFEETYAPEELAYINVQTFTTASDSLGVWLGTEDAGIYRLNFADNRYVLKKVGIEVGLENANIQQIMADVKDELWISTYNGIYKTRLNQVGNDVSLISHFTTENGLNTNYIKQVFLDFEGNSWVATYEKGIARLKDEALLLYTPEELNFVDNITAVTSKDSTVWLGGNGRLLQFNINDINQQRIFSTRNGLPNTQISSLNYQESKEILWIGTEGSGLYQYHQGRIRQVFTATSSMGNNINHITARGDSLVLATRNGIIHIDVNTMKSVQYTTRDGLPYNDIKQLIPAQNGGLLIATRSKGLYIFQNGAFEIHHQSANVELQINSLTHDSLGNIWAATDGNGIVGFMGEDSLVNITKASGLKSDYCYGIETDENGMLWIGHRLGLSKVNPENFLIKTYDQEEGIHGDVNTNAIHVTKKASLVFGTTNGLIVYHPRNDKPNNTPPFANIEQVMIGDEVYDHHETIHLPYDSYKLRIDFLGINLRAPDDVTYQYKLEGYDMEWSDITEMDFAVYPRIEDGEYLFLLKTYNSEGISNTVPASFSIVIQKPIWKRWWFITLEAAILIASVLTIIRIRERRQKQLQDFLQKNLDERTREVVEQKEEIELKNRDITDSINYAQRIQESILPSIKKLQDNFTGSFVFYQPRDIVSGDFYWFDRVQNNKFVIVCADSTGHGVPGAFMSMIGTTLIKDICMRPDMDSPAKTLQLLDSELSGTLNQNLDNEKPNDGMDIVVCEIDTETYQVRFASAMRPIIIYKNGEQEYIRGSRSSIGGQYKDQKVFEEGNIQLSKGDIIYMFSDGYPDQFGGPMGKKFKMVRLKNLLRDIHQKPMEEQYNYVKSTFNLWKEDLDQVDDVLFMGIKI